VGDLMSPEGQTRSNLRDGDIGKKTRVPEGPIYAIGQKHY